MSLTAFRVHPDVFDNGLSVIEGNATLQVACSQEPTTYTEANATYRLGDVTVADADFTIANGDLSGNQPRKITVAQKIGEVTDDGEATWIAWLDVTGSRLLLAKPCDAQVLTEGNSLTFPANKLELLAGQEPCD
jgi:hypothetical protein